MAARRAPLSLWHECGRWRFQKTHAARSTGACTGTSSMTAPPRASASWTSWSGMIWTSRLCARPCRLLQARRRATAANKQAPMLAPRPTDEYFDQCWTSCHMYMYCHMYCNLLRHFCNLLCHVVRCGRRRWRCRRGPSQREVVVREGAVVTSHLPGRHAERGDDESSESM